MTELQVINNPIFVFGCCNSGTTILWQALKKHFALSGPEVEGQDIADLPNSMKHWLGKPTFRLWAHPKFNLCYYVTEKNFNREDAQKIREIYSQFLKLNTRFITKSPADTLRARLIQAIFPDAYFIAIVRNGYAVVEGIRRKRLLDPDRLQFQGLTTTIEEAAEQWFRANTVIVSHQKFLQKYLIVKYEDLIENPKDVFHSILEFCGLDTNDFAIPIFEKGKNQEQIARLSTVELGTITKICGPMLHHFEYSIINSREV